MILGVTAGQGGARFADMVGSAAGVATVTGVGSSFATMVGTAAGVATVTGITPGPLDGYSGISGTWSASRKMLSTYSTNSGAVYHTTSSNIDTLYDQSGNGRNLTDGGSSGRRPSVTTAGSNGITCAAFDGSSDYLSGAAISNFISNSAGYLILTAYIDAVTLNNATPYLNDILLGDQSQFMGIYLRNNGPSAYGFNWDGNADSNSTAFTTSAVHVFEWRHEGGAVYLTVDGTEVSAASGNTSTMTGALTLFGRGSQFATGKFFEAAAFSTVPSSGDRTAIRAALKDYAGT